MLVMVNEEVSLTVREDYGSAVAVAGKGVEEGEVTSSDPAWA
jgi:hypothetical protein